MLRNDDKKQLPLFDPWGHIGPKRRRLLDQGWPGLFQKEIRPILPVELLYSFFKDSGTGRPTKELHTAMGMILLQQMQNLTDEEAIDAMAFNEQWHYALDISDESDDSVYFSLRTLWAYREIIISNGLQNQIFIAISSRLAQVFGVDTKNQRIDSVHIQSNMARLGRTTLMARAIQKFLQNLKRKYPVPFDRLDSKLVKKYFSKQAVDAFGGIRPDESKKKLKEVATDLNLLLEIFKDNEKISDMYSYKLLSRVRDDQCIISPDGKIRIKQAKDIASDSLQNPSDPDAAYSARKGQGFQAQIMETFTDTEDKKEKAATLNLITHVDVEKASEHDTNALIPAINSVEKRGLKPESVLADSLYGSDENVQEAASKGVEIVSPVMGDNKKEIALSDFEFNEKGHVSACPKGHAPEKQSRKKRYSQRFCEEVCQTCELVDQCPVKKGRKGYYLRYKEKDFRVARRRINEKSDEFKDSYRWRAGIEATMSEFDRRTGAKHLRYRRFKSVHYAIVMKAAGLNIFRAAAVRKARIKENPGPDYAFVCLILALLLSNPDNSGLYFAILCLIFAFLIFKEHFFGNKNYRHIFLCQNRLFYPKQFFLPKTCRIFPLTGK